MNIDKLCMKVDKFLDYWFSGEILKPIALICLGYIYWEKCDD